MVAIDLIVQHVHSQLEEVSQSAIRLQSVSYCSYVVNIFPTPKFKMQNETFILACLS